MNIACLFALNSMMRDVETAPLAINVTKATQKTDDSADAVVKENG